MLFQSMTGFGRASLNKDGYEVTVEVKSVNHRFRDIRLKISSRFNSLEIPLRKKIESKFKRGSFELYLNYKKCEEADSFNIDLEKVSQFIASTKKISQQENIELQINAIDFLRNEFSAEVDMSSLEVLGNLILETADLALDDLEVSRNCEGEKLQEIMVQHKRNYVELYKKLPPLATEYRKGVELRLNKALDELTDRASLDQSRMAQEVIYYLEKLDIHEELNRIQSHLKKIEDIFNQGGEVGRQLEFLLQEFNRETNTIGSKSGSSHISDIVVSMKVQLEKMREQALNLV